VSASVSGPSPVSGTLPQLPIANRRTWLLVAALLAGALTALVVILLLHYLGDEPEGEPAPLHGQPAAAAETRNAVEESETTEPAIDETVADEESLPVAPEPPVAEGEPETEPPPTRRRRRARRRESVMADAPAETSQMAQTPLQAARAALRSGDAEACLQRLEGWGSSAPVLRLRADCQLRAGHRSDAVKSYERFCQRYPNDPALPEVRAVVSRYGGRCP